MAYISLAVTVLWGVAGVIFLAGKFFGTSDGQGQRLVDLREHIDERCSAITDEQEKQFDELKERLDRYELDNKTWTAELRKRTHDLSSDMNSLPTRLAVYFMPREVAVTIQQESASDRTRIWTEVQALKIGAEALWKELRSHIGRSRG